MFLQSLEEVEPYLVKKVWLLTISVCKEEYRLLEGALEVEVPPETLLKVEYW